MSAPFKPPALVQRQANRVILEAAYDLLNEWGDGETADDVRAAMLSMTDAGWLDDDDDDEAGLS